VAVDKAARAIRQRRSILQQELQGATFDEKRLLTRGSYRQRAPSDKLALVYTVARMPARNG
jgi:hypothetical protein